MIIVGPSLCSQVSYSRTTINVCDGQTPASWTIGKPGFPKLWLCDACRRYLLVTMGHKYADFEYIGEDTTSI